MKKNFQTFTVLGLVCETERRGTSEEAIKNCLNGKNWILPKNATEAFSFFNMMQTGFTHDFLQLEMERCKKSDFIFDPSKRILQQNDQVGAGSCQERGNQTAVHLQFVSYALLPKFKCS